MANVFDIDEFLRMQAGGAAAPATEAPSAATRFYNRPIPIPGWLKAIGRLGAGPLGWGTTAVGVGAPLLKAAAEGAASAYVGPPGIVGTPERGAAGYGAMARPAPTVAEPATTAVAAPLPALNAEEILRRMAAPPGTGAVSLDGGPAQLIDARTSPEFLASRSPRYGAQPSGGFAGDFMGAMLRMKQVSGDEAAKVAQARAATANLAAQGAYLRGVAAVDVAQRERTAPLYAESVTSLPDPKTGAVSIIDKRTGAVRKVIPAGPPVSEANINASMKTRKLTREQAIAAYKAAGYDVSGLK